MNEKLQALIKRIEESVGTESYFETADSVASQLANLDDPLEAVEPILRILENHEEADFGLPGPLVHFAESQFRKGYEELLLESIRRHPTEHTTWMLNRLINGVSGPEKDLYLSELHRLLTDETLPKSLRERARRYIDHQT